MKAMAEVRITVSGKPLVLGKATQDCRICADCRSKAETKVCLDTRTDYICPYSGPQGCVGCPAGGGCPGYIHPESCDGCENDLGGGCCQINVERECRDGGGFELYKPIGIRRGSEG